MEGVNDEDSRDSGVSVNSNYGQLDIMCTLVEQQHGNEFNVTANSVTNELDIDLADLKVDETCTNLDVLKWSRNAFVNNKATLNKANTPETPLSSLTNKRIHELSNAVELESSPKSRWANIDNICVASDLNEATYCRTPFIESSNFDIEGPGEAHNSGGDSLDMELCWSDELNVTVTDAISVFSEDSNSNLLQLSGSGMLDFSRKQHGISFRRTQSLCAANCDKVKCEVRHMSNEERKLVGDTPLCTQRTMRKRMSAQLVDVGGSLAPKRSKAEIEIAANQQLQKGVISSSTTEVTSNKFWVTEKRAEKERRRSSGIPRILSSGILERGAFAKVRDEQLPKLLEVEYSLQTVRRPQVESGAFRSISAETFIELLTNTDGEQFSRQFVIVDCRYPYEYQGGHVKGAVNIHDPEMVQSFFFPNDDRQFATISHKIPIFYCEFSQKRGPTM
ncbi:M-phase inducer phosphatase cdc-25.1 [Toxocara canis]|uniref:protein-tyrosine-phosphatase n=1 Tax=Toxocara canis TaxID=6265 RepID=A0A0B2UR07_TOXCA|nr:M-phase inducer phosphatase cdc-25.1 [Toxocara canis]